MYLNIGRGNSFLCFVFLRDEVKLGMLKKIILLDKEVKLEKLLGK